MSQTLSRLQQLAGIPLNESTLVESNKSRYMEMFDPILNITDGGDFHGSFRFIIESGVEFARSSLKTEDRIIWHLRHLKIFALRELVNSYYDNPQVLRQGKSMLKRATQQMSRATKQTENQVFQDAEAIARGDAWKATIMHFLSIPYPKIQNVKFAWKTYKELLDEFRVYEEEWAELSKQAGQIVPQEDYHKLVLRFDDGMAWWNLNKAVCKAEGDAMDHCGNDAMHDPDDTILSLRSPIENSKKLAPHLTFILDQQGMIGEMKGRNNQKPSKKYYKYIVALLQSDGIRGITGGGYKPENNFSVMDLPESVRTQLVNDKPDLANLETKIKMFGWDDPRIQTQLERVLGEYNIPMVESVEERQVVIKSWDMISDFIREISEHDNVALSILDAIEDVKSDEGQVFNPDDRRSWLQSLRNEMTTYLKNLFEFIISGVILEFDSKSVEVENGKCAVKIWNDEFFETVDALDKYTNSDNFNALDIDDEIVYNAERLMTNKDWLFLEDGDHIDLGDYGVETRMDDSKLAINYWKRKEFEVRVSSLDSQQNSTFK